MFLDEKRRGEVGSRTLETHQLVLLRAAEIIEQRGLRKRNFGGNIEDETPVCTLRAIDIAVKDHFDMIASGHETMVRGRETTFGAALERARSCQ